MLKLAIIFPGVILILNNALAVSVSGDTLATSGGQRKACAGLQVGQRSNV